MEHYNSICEYICENWYLVTINFISTLIGAFLGFVFALIIYRIGERNKRKNQRKAEKLKAYNTLKRFSYLLKSVLNSCSEQNKAFDSHSKELKRKPLNFHFPQLLAINDRERLVKSDSIELYYSFMLYDKENEDKFKDYKNIFNHADFLQKHYSDLFIQNEKHQNFLHSDLKVISDNLLTISIKIELIRKSMQLKYPKEYNSYPEFQFLEKYRNIYIKLKGVGFTDLEPYRDNFLIPLELELFENITEQKLAGEIASEIASALARMENVVLNTNTHADDFTNIDNDKYVKSALDFIDKIKNKIEEINEP